LLGITIATLLTHSKRIYVLRSGASTIGIRVSTGRALTAGTQATKNPNDNPNEATDRTDEQNGHFKISHGASENGMMARRFYVMPNDRVERPATMTVPRPDAAHDS
jgi:hypothetical protein